MLTLELQQIWLDSFKQAFASSNSEVAAYQAAWFKVFQTAFPGEIVTPTDNPLAGAQVPPPVSEGQPAGQALPAGIPAMASEYGYIVDFASVKLDESVTGCWIQAMPLGDYTHPVHGDISITPERVKQFALNVKNKVRGTDLDIDYDHKDKSTEAAGWVKDAEARTDGLWIFVEWTKTAFQKIKDKAYRYFSPEFSDEWTHPKTGTKYTDVLFGGGITNRPFLKDILPINMSEVFGNVKLSGGVGMDEEQRKLFAKLCGLPEDASVEQILGALQVKLSTQPPEQPPVETPPTPDPNAPEGDEDEEEKKKNQQPQQVAAGEGLSEEVIRLAEQSTDPVVKALVASVQAQNKTLSEQSAALHLAEVNVRMDRITTGKKFAIPAVVRDKLRETMLKSPKQLNETLSNIFDTLCDVGMVELGERGKGRDHESGDTAVKRFSDAVTKSMTNDKLSYADAVERVASLQPQLFEEYRQESFAFREV